MATEQLYLDLHDRISQKWFNQYTIIVVIMIVKLKLFSTLLLSSLHTSELYTKLACNSLSNYASEISSLPQYMTLLSNQMVTYTMNEANKGLLELLQLAVLGVEELILFTIDLVVGTYACILTLTIDSTVDVAANVTRSAVKQINETMLSFASDLQSDLNTLSGLVNDVISLANKVKALVEGDDSDSNIDSNFNKIDLTISDLKNWQLNTTSIDEKLTKLTLTVPDFDDVKNYTETLISIPFTGVRNLIKNSTVNILKTNDLKSFNDVKDSSVDSKVAVCSIPEITKFYNHLSSRVNKATNLIIILLAIVSLIFVLLLIYFEVRRWRRLVEVAQDPTIPDAKEKILIYESRLSNRIGQLIARPFPVNSQHSLRWLVLYIGSDNSILVLQLGLSGVIVVVLQYVILRVGVLNNDTLYKDLAQLATSLDTGLTKGLQSWAKDTNSVILSKQNQVNDGFLSSIHKSASAINSTVSGFTDKMDDAIKDVFQETPLYSYVKDLVGCLLEDKLEKIEDGLTWVYDHSQISFPQVNDSFIIQTLNENVGKQKSVKRAAVNASNSTSSLSSSSNSVQIFSDAKKSLKLGLVSIVKHYENSLRIELYISLALILVWLLQFGIGLLFLALRKSTRRTPPLQDPEKPEKPELNYNLNAYDISKPLSMTQSQILTYTSQFEAKNLSDPKEKVREPLKSWATRSMNGKSWAAKSLAASSWYGPSSPTRTRASRNSISPLRLGVIDRTLNKIIKEDIKLYGYFTDESEDDVTNEVSEQASEVLSYQQSRDLITGGRMSTKWVL